MIFLVVFVVTTSQGFGHRHSSLRHVINNPSRAGKIQHELMLQCTASQLPAALSGGSGGFESGFIPQFDYTGKGNQGLLLPFRHGCLNCSKLHVNASRAK